MSAETAQTESTMPFIGRTSGRALERMGTLVIRGWQNIEKRRAFEAVRKAFPLSPVARRRGNLATLVEDLLEFAKYVFQKIPQIIMLYADKMVDRVSSHHIL